MKRYIIIILILMPLVSYAQQNWMVVSNPTVNNLKKVFFADTLKGWAVGDSGIIIHTTNGGTNWITQNSKTRFFLHDIFFINKNTGWALGWNLFNPTPPYGTLMLKTTNGGNVWDTITFPIENIFLRKIYFIDSLTGFMGGVGINLFKTTNKGENWFEVAKDSIMGSGLPVSNFEFYNKNYGFAMGGAMDIAGVVWKTTNNGNYWRTFIISPEPIFGMHYFDSLNIMALGGDFEYGPGMVKSSNAGENWSYQSLELFGMPISMAFRTSSEAYSALGFAQQFLVLIDNGSRWYTTDTPDSLVVNDIVFPDSLHGYAVCDNGKILKYIPLVSGISNENNIIKDFKLYQNYPNPFNPYTTISYVLNTSSYVILKIYDITGREIKKYNQGFQQAGTYNIRYDASGLASGIYFYEIAVRDLTGKRDYFVRDIKKMAVVK